MKRVIKEFFLQLFIALIIAIILPVGTKFLTNNNIAVVVVSIIAGVSLICLVVRIFTAPKNPRSYEKNNSGLTSKRYSIVIIDDEFGDRRNTWMNDFRKFFEKYDILYLKSVNDVRLLEAFDIVILDYLKANDNRDDTDDIFKDLSNRYPEKYVIAMSTNSTKCKEIEDRGNANANIAKPINSSGKVDVNEWKHVIDIELEKAFHLLDKPEEYWNKIQEKMKSNQECDFARNRYIHFLENHSFFKLKKSISIIW